MGVISCGTTMLDQGVFQNIGAVTWDTTVKTSGFTAVSGNGYFVNTTSAAITVTLPAGSAGDIVALADYAATWQTNAVTVTPNGTDKIGAVNSSVALNTEGQSVTFIYSDSTQGWLNTMDSTSNVRGSPFIAATGGTITTCGDYKIHKFTGPGTFTVTAAGAPTGSTTVDYLVIAGGGGAAGHVGAGAGAGGARMSSGTASGCYTASPLGACVAALPVSVTAYPITVGGGGAGVPSWTISPNSGSNSIFSTITSAGGAGGGSFGFAAKNGGSGGGAPSNANGGFPTTVVGLGNTPPTSPPQGNNGGQGLQGPTPTDNSGGGGGAGAVGTNATMGQGGAGGAGIQNNICGSNYYWSGGGGGSSGYSPGQSAVGGAGGIGGGGGASVQGSGPGGAGGGSAINNGGSGTAGPGATGGSGGANSGGGAGGGSHPGGFGGSGGSGIVIIRYKFQ